MRVCDWCESKEDVETCTVSVYGEDDDDSLEEIPDLCVKCETVLAKVVAKILEDKGKGKWVKDDK